MSDTPKVSSSAAKEILWHRGVLKWKLDANQKELYDLFHNTTDKVSTWLLARRSGKCLKKGSLIMTPNGPKPIEEFKPGDLVYGYNFDGTVSLTPVLDVVYSGEKWVRDIISNNRVLETSTDEHPWLWENYKGDIVQKRLGDTKLKTHKLSRVLVDVPMGEIDEPHAYAIGAFLGDGCSTSHDKNILKISSENDIIPKHISEILNVQYYRSNPNNYTWILSHESRGKRGSGSVGRKKVICNYYDQWCRNRYAHEKIADLNVIKTWNRKSILKFLAGLIDTDGSVYISENNLTIGIGMQAKPVIDAIKWIIFSLFQCQATVFVDNREKYKNGPVYNINIKNNYFAKRILKEINPYLVVERKKWKPEYQALPERNCKPEKVGVKLGKYYRAECYDLSIGNETHLYLTANGFVTHNTYALCVIALETCLKKPNSIVKFVAPQKAMIRTIVRPIFRQILEDCPKEILPEFKTQESLYRFHNGSEIQLGGTDSGNAESIRGGFANICIVDEAGFCDDLGYVVNSVLLPTTLTTKGKIILSSTPPKIADHEFTKFVNAAEDKGKLIKKTIYDNKRLTQQDIDDTIAAYPGGVNNPEFKREYLCQQINDLEKTVVPEFTQELEELIVKEWERPSHFDCYESVDPGGRDLTAALFGYFDFLSGKIIIEDEYFSNDPEVTTDKLAAVIKQKEKELWYNPLIDEVKKPKRIIDNNNVILVRDLNLLHKLDFITTAKDDKHAAINNMRILLANKQIIIHPRCKGLIRHLKRAVWNKQRTSYERSAENGHYDLLDCLVYLCRNVNFNNNPFPPNTYGSNWHINKGTTNQNSKLDQFKRIFKLKN